MITLVNSFGDVWLSYFGLKVVQDTLFLMLIFVALAALKNASAQAKYMLSLLALAKLLLPPFLPFRFSGGSLPEFLPLPDAPANVATPATTTEFAPLAPQISITGLLFVVWLAVVLTYLLIFVFFNVVQKRRLLSARPLANEHAAAHNITVLQMTALATPLSVGLFSNKVYLPSYWEKLPGDCRRVLLQHEIAHIKRRDGVVQLLQTVAQALFFFHPLVWLLNERINEYREMACDDTAIATSQLSPVAYSRYLVHIAEKMVQPVWPFSSASALIKQKNKLLNRVNYQIKETKMKPTKAVVLIIVLMALMIAPLSWYCSKDKSLDSGAPEESANQTKMVALSGEVAYDTPPQPIGGYSALSENLVYPDAAKQAGIEGRTILNVLIDASGKVMKTSIINSSGNEACDKAAAEAVLTVNWQPAKKNGQPVSVWIGVPFDFKLNSQNPTDFKPVDKKADWSKYGLYSITYSHILGEQGGIQECEAIFYCELTKTGYLKEAKLIKSSGDSKKDNGYLTYLKSNKVIGIADGVKEPIFEYVGFKSK